MAGTEHNKQSNASTTTRNDQPGSSVGGMQVGTGGVGHDTADAARDRAKTANHGGAPLPHERDQAHGNVDAQPRDVMKQAKRDLDAGMVDTDMRATPGLDAAQRDRLVPPPANKS